MPRPLLYLGNKNYSSWSLRPWLAMRHAGIEFDEEIIPLDRPETTGAIRAASPGGKVPALRHGDLVIWESLAICEYAAEMAPAAHLWPADARQRALARAVACEMHAGFAALRNTMTMNIRRPPAAIARSAEVDADIARILHLWEERRAAVRAAGTAGDFLFGAFTIADAMFAPVVTRFRSYAVPLTGAAAAYSEAIWGLPAMKEWEQAARAETLRIEK